MRKMTTALATLLLAVTSAQGGYTLSLESDGLNSVSGSIFTVDLMLASDGQPSISCGDTAFLGAQTALAPLPAGWSVSGLTYNTLDFDSQLTVPGDLGGLIGIATADTPYVQKKRLLSFTLVVPAFDVGVLALDPSQTAVLDSLFNTVYVGPGDVAIAPLWVNVPEPATALLLIAALPLLRRRRA